MSFTLINYHFGYSGPYNLPYNFVPALYILGVVHFFFGLLAASLVIAQFRAMVGFAEQIPLSCGFLNVWKPPFCYFHFFSIGCYYELNKQKTIIKRDEKIPIYLYSSPNISIFFLDFPMFLFKFSEDSYFLVS